MYFILLLPYILSINFILILTLVLFYYNYSVQRHKQRCCWNGAIEFFYFYYNQLC